MNYCSKKFYIRCPSMFFRVERNRWIVFGAWTSFVFETVLVGLAAFTSHFILGPTKKTF
jgi:hypothetical protein